MSELDELRTRCDTLQDLLNDCRRENEQLRAKRKPKKQTEPERENAEAREEAAKLK